jgi:AraC-like DNA-binding protein
MVIGDVATAAAIALRAVRVYEEVEDLKLVGIWRRAVASTLYYQGKYGAAVIEAERSAEVQPDPCERARSLVLFGELSAWYLEANTAFHALGRAEEIARSFRSDALLNALVYGLRAEVLSAIGDLDQGIVDGERSAEVFQRNGLFLKAAIQLNNVGFWLAKTRHFKLAERRLLDALELQKKEPNVSNLAAIYDSLGYMYTVTGQRSEAESALTQSVKIFEGVHNHAETAASRLHLSKLYQQMRQYRTAHDEAARVLKLATETKLDRLRIEASNLLMSLESDINRYPENGRMKVQRARRFIDNNLQRNLALKELARVVHISPYRLAHLFKAETGTSPASYVKASRMLKSKQLLESSSLSVKQIMLNVGVSDESHFSRDFKKRYGLSPAQYRARYRARFLAEQQLSKKKAAPGSRIHHT